MANWQNKIDVSGEWRAAQGDPQGFRKVAQSAHRQLADLGYQDDDDLDLILYDLDALVHDPDATVDEFDEVWDQLYDWADDGHRLWIAR